MRSCFKKYFSFNLAVLLVFLGPVAALGADLSALTSVSYILMDADTGEILVSKDEHRSLPPASMTKLMTLLLALEALEEGKTDLTARLPVSAYAASMEGSEIYLQTGESILYEDLLFSVALASANDSSVVLAEYLSGSEAAFAAAMNRKAQDIGLTDTHFMNANGLPQADHYSSAADMANLARYMLQSTDILRYTAEGEYRLTTGLKISNTNELLDTYAGLDGLKTGWTTEAGHCLTATAEREGLRLISAVMGSSLVDGQFEDTTALLDEGFSRYAYHHFFSAGEICGEALVARGAEDSVPLRVVDEAGASYERAGGNLSYELRLNSNISAPIAAGEILGHLVIGHEGLIRKEIPVTAAAPVERGGVWREIQKMFRWTLTL